MALYLVDAIDTRCEFGALDCVNMKKSYTYLYNPDDAQNRPVKNTRKYFLVEDIIKYKNQKFSKCLNYKIYSCGPSKDRN